MLGKKLFYFQRYDVIKFGLIKRERVTNSDIKPQKLGLLTGNQTFMASNIFPDPRLYHPLQI